TAPHLDHASAAADQLLQAERTQPAGELLRPPPIPVQLRHGTVGDARGQFFPITTFVLLGAVPPSGTHHMPSSMQNRSHGCRGSNRNAGPPTVALTQRLRPNQPSRYQPRPAHMLRCRSVTCAS